MNLRRAARGQPCALEIVGVCNGNVETTVMAHIRGLGFGEGIARKPDDDAAVFACSACHDALDYRTKHFGESGRDTVADRWWYIARAIIRTHRNLRERGLL